MRPEQLKNSILQLAIQGKLVEQRKEEGTGEELYKEIQEEKKRLINEGKIKKQKALPEISEDEIPFDIPDNWKWCYIGEIFNHISGKALNSKNTEGVLKKYITTSNVYWDSFKLDNLKEMYYTEDEIEKYKLKLNDLLVLEGGDVGRAAIWNLPETYCFQNHIHRLRPFFNVCIKYFYYNFMLLKNKKLIGGKGIGIKSLSSGALHRIVVPLPPLEEQKRIVEKIEELLLLVERYEKAWTRLEELNKKFPLDMKKSILEEAIQGKLVEQRVAERTGQELYKEIQEEKQKLIEEGKLKKQKVLPEIREDEIPFDIPETWKWVRLRGIVYNHGQKKPSSTFSYIDISSIDNENQKLNKNENIIEAEKAPSRARKIVHMNDVLYATVRPYLHNMCIIDKEFVYPPIASTGFAVMACYNNFYNKYLFYYLLSPTFDRYANSIENSKGVAYPAINDERLYKAVVPLPPLAEQKRIVEKIEELLPLCEKLK